MMKKRKEEVEEEEGKKAHLLHSFTASTEATADCFLSLSSSSSPSSLVSPSSHGRHHAPLHRAGNQDREQPPSISLAAPLKARERGKEGSFSPFLTAAPTPASEQAFFFSFTLSQPSQPSLSSIVLQVKQGTGLLPATFIPTSNARNELMLKEVRKWRRKKRRSEKSIIGAAHRRQRVSSGKPKNSTSSSTLFSFYRNSQYSGRGLRRAPQGAREGDREHQGGDGG